MSSNKILDLLRKFLKKNPNASPEEIAQHFYDLGVQAGMSETCDLF